MKLIRLILIVAFAGTTLASANLPEYPRDLKNKGAFGFPQDKATMLCDTKELRVSAWNDGAHLYVQAVLWTDGDDALGETPDGREIGDNSVLVVDSDGDGKVTPNVDRAYHLNPWPKLPGLRYQVELGGNGHSGIKADSKGRGSVQYVETSAGKVRVDSFVIPLAELGRKAGDKVRLAYYGKSPKPELTLNSIGYERMGAYYSFNLPWAKFHELTLADRPVALDLKNIPDGRDEKVALQKKPVKAMPKVGTVPPEVAAKDWLNATKAPSLAGLRGKVVVVEFWATWCGPCVAGIPHLNKLHDEYGPKGLDILSFTDQSKAGIQNFMNAKSIKYVVGTGSELAAEYGVEGIPHAFIIGKDGKLIWDGNPNDTEFDKQVAAALEAK